MGLKLNESFGGSEFMGTRIDLLRSYLDPSSSSQSKQDSNFQMYRFFANNFRTKKDSGFIKAPSCFSLQDTAKRMFLYLERSSSKFDLRSTYHYDRPKLTLTPEVDPAVTSNHILTQWVNKIQ